MKKVFLSAAALMIGAIGFAQVTGAPEAESQDPLVVPNNSANVNANKGKSVQEGDDQRVRVRQAGTQQSVYTWQANGSAAGGNHADVIQFGDVNSNPASGVLNEADVYQQGELNRSYTMQQGDRNNALTRQGMTDDASSGNNARIQQGNNGNAEDNFAAIDQDGNTNEAQTFQTYDNNDAYTDQDGDNLSSYVRQIASPDGSDGHWAFVDQQGDGNRSWVWQDGAGARNFAQTSQDGLNNYAEQNQTSTGLTGELGNRAVIVQGMEPELPGGGIGWSTDVSEAMGTVAKLQLVDDITPGVQSLYSEEAEAYQDQVGSDNLGLIAQMGEPGNYAEQDQTGDENSALIYQNIFGNVAGGGNTAEQEQLGDLNEAGISQNGSGHKASQLQIGDLNTALSTQRGEDNKAFTFQYGNDNWVSTAQRGHDNLAVVTQYGGQSYIAEQNLTDGMPFGNNQIDVIQMDGTGDINIAQEECIIDYDEPNTWTTPSFNLDPICQDCN